MSRSSSIPRKVIESVKLFLSELSKVIRVEKAYVFGSYARGDWIRESDVDLIVVSSDFEGMRMTKRFDLVNEIAYKLEISPPLEVIPLTPEELERGSVIVRDAKSYWIEIDLQ